MQPTHSQATTDFAGFKIPTRYLRLVLPVLVLMIYVWDSSVRTVIHGALSDAYIAVSVFVAITLLGYYVVEKRFDWDSEQLEHKHPIIQIATAAVLGALPGCGGAIIIVSQYAVGRTSFAAFVAVLVSTMGDAAFLILATAPKTGLLITSVGIVAGIATGSAVHYLHKPDFMRQPRQSLTENCHQQGRHYPWWGQSVWLVILVAAFPLTLLSSFQMESPTLYDIDITIAIGVLGAIICVLFWSELPLRSAYQGIVAESRLAKEVPITNETTDKKASILSRVIDDTNFITVWVVAAFLLFELTVHYTGLNIAGLFDSALWLAPLIGVIVGFLPGCGPQIIIASLYLQGIAPLSTLLGNAISNDGDALFPAIALAPKAAIIATLYSAIPAVIISYSVYFLS